MTTEDLEEHGQRESLAITTLLEEGFLPLHRFPRRNHRGHSPFVIIRQGTTKLLLVSVP